MSFKAILILVNSNRAVILINLVLFFILTIMINCERQEIYYRPDLAEQLCSVGIIDADDTSNYKFSIHDILDIRNSSRFITFERSFQSEYTASITDSLSDFIFSISTMNRDVFSFSSKSKIKSPAKFEFPHKLIFKSGETYSLHAKVNDLPEISAACTVPDPPGTLILNSIESEDLWFHLSTPCRVRNGAKSAIFNVSFSDLDKADKFYMVLLVADGLFGDNIPFSGPYDFSIVETNTQGFLSEVFGMNSIYWECINNQSDLKLSQIFAYFVEGSSIPNAECRIKLSVQYKDGISPLERLDHVQIKLLSIPKDLFLFEKNLYNYSRVKNDPFSEPVYLMGNILHGNGVFSICRSSNVMIDLTNY